jgi:hypothetical protein
MEIKQCNWIQRYIMVLGKSISSHYDHSYESNRSNINRLWSNLRLRRAKF